MLLPSLTLHTFWTVCFIVLQASSVCALPPLGLCSCYPICTVLSCTYSNAALSSKCHTPSPRHHFHPHWSFSLGLDYLFKASVNTLLFVYVCVPHGIESEYWVFYLCASLIAPGTVVGTQTMFSLKMADGWLKKNDTPLVRFSENVNLNVISSEKRSRTLPQRLSVISTHFKSL